MMKVDIYSDVACPWCYIGKRRFESALAEYEDAGEVEVVFRPYQLDPAAPRPGVAMKEYLKGRFGQAVDPMVDRVVETARDEGLPMDYESGIAANTLDAHRLLGLAETELGAEAQQLVAERLFAAHFNEGLDISDPDVLVKIGADAGLPEERTRKLLDSEAGVAEVRAEIETAQRIGIRAVPTFVFDGQYAVQGAQPTELFLRAFAELKSRDTTE